MVWLIAVLAVAAELPLADTVERIANLDCEPAVETRPLERTVAVRCPAGAARLLRARSDLCPTAAREGDRVVFHCATSRLAAHASPGVLQLLRLRGLPIRGEDGPPPGPPSAEL